ncbi:MAG: hypothetical protein J6333_11260, partial [Planctomycetes bacterium]|nr:hypothetical protein [Planctomycetota bacterium]
MAKKETIFAQFTKQYKLSKTLRFELKPMGATLANMKKSGVLNHDFDRGEAYQAVKDVLDEHHKKLIEDATRDFDATFTKTYAAMSATDKKTLAPILDAQNRVDWEKLAAAYEKFRLSAKAKEDRDELEAMNALYRKAIV